MQRPAPALRSLAQQLPLVTDRHDREGSQQRQSDREASDRRTEDDAFDSAQPAQGVGGGTGMLSGGGFNQFADAVECGVDLLVVDAQGRLQLVNRAAQAMLRVEPAAHGRLYLEAIRHPDITALLTAALRGEEAGSHELALSRGGKVTAVNVEAGQTVEQGQVLVVLE